MKYGHARVSTTDQDLTIQVEALTNAGCKTIRQEKVSGTSVQGRDELNTLLEFLRDGDELVVTRVDRLARSIRDLQNIVYDLDKRGVTLSATKQPLTPRRVRESISWICWESLVSLRRTFAKNDRWRV